MKGQKKTLFVIALLLLVGLTSGYIASTYAKYASEIKDNEGTATVAKWKFTTDNQKQTFDVNLEGTPHATTLHEGRIAPGTKGSFEIKLSNGTTETGVDFTVKLKPVKLKEAAAGASEGGAADTTGTIPENLKFYKDAERTKELVPETGVIKGQLAANDPTELPIKIYWAWEFGTSDEVSDAVNVADTTAGEAASSLTIGLDITGVQTKPGETAISSRILPEA